MDVPVMYFVNCGFAWCLMLLCIAGYFYILRKTGKKWAFWPIFAGAWLMYGVSHSLILSGVSASEWYMTLLRVLGYLLVVASLFSLITGMKKTER